MVINSPPFTLNWDCTTRSHGLLLLLFYIVQHQIVGGGGGGGGGGGSFNYRRAKIKFPFSHYKVFSWLILGDV